MDETFEMIQRGVNRRQEELNRFGQLLAKRARLNTWTASAAKVVLVIVGALTATKASADLILGAGNVAGVVAYTVLGVITAGIAGITAAFDFDQRSSQLTQLAAEAWTTLREVDSEWRRSVALSTTGHRSDPATKIIELQDKKLADLQGRAARLGINVALDVPELISATGPGPYAA